MVDLNVQSALLCKNIFIKSYRKKIIETIFGILHAEDREEKKKVCDRLNVPPAHVRWLWKCLACLSADRTQKEP